MANWREWSHAELEVCSDHAPIRRVRPILFFHTNNRINAPALNRAYFIRLVLELIRVDTSNLRQSYEKLLWSHR